MTRTADPRNGNITIQGSNGVVDASVELDTDGASPVVRFGGTSPGEQQSFAYAFEAQPVAPYSLTELAAAVERGLAEYIVAKGYTGFPEGSTPPVDGIMVKEGDQLYAFCPNPDGFGSGDGEPSGGESGFVTGPDGFTSSSDYELHHGNGETLKLSYKFVDETAGKRRIDRVQFLRGDGSVRATLEVPGELEPVTQE